MLDKYFIRYSEVIRDGKKREKKAPERFRVWTFFYAILIFHSSSPYTWHTLFFFGSLHNFFFNIFSITKKLYAIFDLTKEAAKYDKSGSV